MPREFCSIASRGLCLQLFFVLNIAITAIAGGQTPNCAPGTAQRVLDGSGVRASILNRGGFLFRDGYQVQQGAAPTLFGLFNLWFAGLSNDELRGGGEWGPGHVFLPGPLDDSGLADEDCSRFDRIYRVGTDDLERFEWSGVASADLEDWPTGLGAPTLDRLGNRVRVSELPYQERLTRSIDLGAGERPDLYGDQMVWWVMNDRGSDAVPLFSKSASLEVQSQAWVVDSWPYMHQQSFWRVRLINRGEDLLEEAYVGLFSDPDVGGYGDDYVGSDTTLGLAFAYNADSDDSVYGETPPALGIKVLGVNTEPGLEKESTGLGNRGMRFFGRIEEDPRNVRWVYDFLTGHQATYGGGVRWTSCGVCVSGGTPVDFWFPGDPVTSQAWSEVNTDGSGSHSEMRDRVMVLSAGSFSLAPGEHIDLDFAILWARGSNHLNSITLLRHVASTVQASYDRGTITMTSAEFGLDPDRPSAPVNPAVGRVFPNPFSESAVLRYRVDEGTQVRISILDILGREVAALVDRAHERGEHTISLGASETPSGVYVIRTQIGRGVDYQTVVRVR